MGGVRRSRAPDLEKRLAALEAVCAALAHPARRQMLLIVRYWGGSMTAGDIARRFGHAWPTTTRHLKVLVEAGLLTPAREGRTRRYRLQRGKLGVVREWLAAFETASSEERQDEPSARTPRKKDRARRGPAPKGRARVPRGR